MAAIVGPCTCQHSRPAHILKTSVSASDSSQYFLSDVLCLLLQYIEKLQAEAELRRHEEGKTEELER